MEVAAWFWRGLRVLKFFMAVRSFAVPRTMAGDGCNQHFGLESKTLGTGLLQVFLRTSILAQAVLKILETLLHS